MNLRASWESHGVRHTAFIALLIPAIRFGLEYPAPPTVFLCFLIGFPLTFARSGKLTLIPAWIAVAGLVVTSVIVIVATLDHSWPSWETACLVILCAGYGSFIPVAAAFLGCAAASSIWQLWECWQRQRDDARPIVADMRMPVWVTAFFLVTNLALIEGAVRASRWLQEHRIYPFQEGFWNVLVCFIPAPPWVHEALVTQDGAFLFPASAVAFGTLAIFGAKRSSEPKIASNVGLLSFVAIGFPALWAIGDMFINYYTHDVAFEFWSKR